MDVGTLAQVQVLEVHGENSVGKRGLGQRQRRVRDLVFFCLPTIQCIVFRGQEPAFTKGSITLVILVAFSVGKGLPWQQYH